MFKVLKLPLRRTSGWWGGGKKEGGRGWVKERGRQERRRQERRKEGREMCKSVYKKQEEERNVQVTKGKKGGYKEVRKRRGKRKRKRG